VAFTYDCYGHLFPEIDHLAAVKLEAIRTRGLGATAVVGSISVDKLIRSAGRSHQGLSAGYPGSS
jgi:hypothetical protein